MNFRGPSPLPAYGSYEAALEAPVDTLPHTVFPHLTNSGGYITPVRPDSRSSRFSPMPTRDHQQDVAEETAAITSQVLLISFREKRKSEFPFIICVHLSSF